MMTSMNNDFNKLLPLQQPQQTTENPLMTINNSATTLYASAASNTNLVLAQSTTSVPELLIETAVTTAANSSNNNSEESSGSSAGEAVFLPTYAALPTTKLEEEPNPFEQSFKGATTTTTSNKKYRVLPSVETMNTPTSINRLGQLMKGNEQWDSLRSGILSPSMLNGPTDSAINNVQPQSNNITTLPIIKYDANDSNNSSHYQNTIIVNNNNKRPKNNPEPSSSSTKKRASKTANGPEDEEKRKNFLERNRIAALKCRQRKKQWLQNLQDKVEYLTADNEQLHLQTNALKEELIQLKTLLMAHKDCPVNQPDLQTALNRPIPGITTTANAPHLILHHEASTTTTDGSIATTVNNISSRNPSI
ncbi:MAG: hypothetical protein EXX96DRAFT_654234 [Benjaminiella poitrasii]|nr:MAG: hypothetical protein EXX96DRAFT_654234 [Benjaminiella poitrasii]